MSSILKALKKLEHDKAVRKPDTFKIDTDILHSRSHRSSFSGGALCAMVAIFACGVGATYILMKSDKTPQPAVQQPPQTHVIDYPVKASTGSAVIPATVIKGAEPQTRKSPAMPTALKTTINTRPADAKLKPTPQNMEGPRLPAQAESAVTIQQSIGPEPLPVPPAPVTSSAAITGRPALKVNGIAYQDGSKDGVAVVNGVAVSRGSVIEGAKVEEIQKDRVRFSRGADKFEVILQKSD